MLLGFLWEMKKTKGGGNQILNENVLVIAKQRQRNDERKRNRLCDIFYQKGKIGDHYVSKELSKVKLKEKQDIAEVKKREIRRF